MKFAGIIAEYNPLHLGHLYHIEQTRKKLGQDACVVVLMSGNYVQRGHAAIFEKYSRARAAVASPGCADLVLELPVTTALSSAEGFAQGAVRLFQRLGGIDCLSFGSESGRIDELMETVSLLSLDSFTDGLKRNLAEGISFAAARHQAVEALSPQAADVLKSPNNILAVEYLKALNGSGIRPITVKRAGAPYHSTDANAAYPSATAMRAMLLADDAGWKGRTTAEAAEFIQAEMDAGRGPVTLGSIEQALLARLRLMPYKQYDILAHGEEGLGRRLMKYTRTEPTIEAIAQNTKTKRYAYSRIMRLILCAALGIGQKTLTAQPEYVRVLALNEKGRLALKRFHNNGGIPIVTKYGDMRSLTGEAFDYFRLEAAATDLYHLGFPSASQRMGGAEYKKSAVYIG